MIIGNFLFEVNKVNVMYQCNLLIIIQIKIYFHQSKLNFISKDLHFIILFLKNSTYFPKFLANLDYCLRIDNFA